MYYEVIDFKKVYKDKIVLENINFALKKGDIVSFVGKSGAGKTTLFNLLAGFEKPTEGKILLNKKDITNAKKNISYMMQKPLLLEHMTVLKNIELPLFLKKMDKQKIKDIITPLLKDFELNEHLNKYPNQLSGGLKQKVAFLRAYLKKGDIMLLDEPFSALDSITKHYIYIWIKEIIEKRENTIIFITHDINEAILLSDKIFVINKTIVYSLNIDKNKRNEKKEEYYNKIIKLI